MRPFLSHRDILDVRRDPPLIPECIPHRPAAIAVDDRSAPRPRYLLPPRGTCRADSEPLGRAALGACVTCDGMLRHRWAARDQLKFKRGAVRRAAAGNSPVPVFLGGLVEHIRTMATVLVLGLLTLISGRVFSQEAPSSPILLKGPTMGTVSFPHSAHTRVAGKCEVCHHGSKPAKPLKSPQQPCTDCHTKPPTPPVTISLQAAFHNPAASAGLCITCHKTENNRGRAAPVKCTDCHKKENS